MCIFRRCSRPADRNRVSHVHALLYPIMAKAFRIIRAVTHMEGRIPRICRARNTERQTRGSDRQRRPIVDAALAATESTAWKHRRLVELSGGERQRVLLSRALATQSPVLLLDEPTTHLDPPHQVALARLFRRLASTHTVITVLHDLPLAVQADRLLVMRDGAVTEHGESNDASLHAALVDAFDQAIAVKPAAASDKRPSVSLRLDD